MIHFTEKDEGNIRIATLKKNIPKDQLSERILRDIQFVEEEGNTLISDDDFQLIISDAAAAWTVRRKDDGSFLAEIGKNHLDEKDQHSWSKNLRDAMVLTEENKAQMIVFALLNYQEYEPVPLIYQVDPFYESNKR